MSQGEILFINAKQYLAENSGKRSSHHKLPRIVMQGITGVNEKIRLKMTLVEEGTFCGNSVNYIILKNQTVSPKYLLALLNSTLINFLFKKTSTNSNVNGYEVDNLPIRIAAPPEQKRVFELVDRILAAKRRNLDADTTAWEREIDQLVYKLYGLTADEITLVEESRAR